MVRKCGGGDETDVLGSVLKGKRSAFERFLAASNSESPERQGAASLCVQLRYGTDTPINRPNQPHIAERCPVGPWYTPHPPALAP